jgi:hypothetical protein
VSRQSASSNLINRFARRGEREPAHRTGRRLAGGGDHGHATGAPARPAAPARANLPHPDVARLVSRGYLQDEEGSDGYFLFLRWIRVFFSSLRCFFFAIRLRRFLMTEPIRPPSLRHNGRRARHRSPAAGRRGARPKLDRRVNDNRSRSAPAYPLPHGGGTAMPGRRPGIAGARVAPVPSPSSGGALPSPEEAQARTAARFRGCRTPTLRCPAPAKTPVVA